MGPLDGIRVVTTALNVPGPVACARLRSLGASIAKVEPPEGDPLAGFAPDWYRALHEGVEVGRLDLKGETGRRAIAMMLGAADILLTAQRPSALERMGLGPDAIARFPRLVHVAIVGHSDGAAEAPGHDLTYLAACGLVRPGELPPTLFADMAGAERAVSAALALLLARQRGAERSASVALAEVAATLAQPLAAGLTRPGAIVGGGFAGYHLYAARKGWIAVAALEPRFARRLAEKFGLPGLTVEALRDVFAAHDAEYWEAWAADNDLPIVALRDVPSIVS
jgi:alpha-methylacyl-CoA racemase